ncbi:MAG: 50S ribosomal protein L6 [Candidatus Beckwithbacteria bacterium]|nr:50S ribosomal protein L6 [Patescibacteria group bacterium]
MSRIGKQPVIIPKEVTLEIKNDLMTVSSKGNILTQTIPAGIEVTLKDNLATVTVKNSSNQTKAYHGLVRSLLFNMVEGVTKGYSKTLVLEGTGFRVEAKDKGIELSLGFSHPVIYQAPESIKIEVKDNKTIIISGADKQLVGQVAAKIREYKKPDSYKGKGVRYQGEVVKLKPGKSAKAAEA